MIAALGDPSFIVRVASIKALGAIGPSAQAAVAKLIEALGDELLAIYATSALGAIGPAARAAIPALAALISSAPDDLRAPALLALHRIERSARTKTAAIAELSAILARGADDETRSCASIGLAELAITARG